MTIKHGFELLQERSIPEINSQARVFRHVKTGARLLSLVNDDENKCFSITFATPPPDSTGLPHIMEHAVLAGSRKYRVKEPFVELMKGSLNTFLNAFTMPDRTSYPVASQNLQDFYNLIDVYLDAVFYPLLRRNVLDQEGWHYELNNPDDPLTYKGIVFNEMKGAYSSPNDVLGRHSQHALFPDIVYRNDSGGDPEVIPNLTFEQFKAFHKTFYHPSNAYIFIYGDDPEADRLRILDEYLRDFEPRQIDIDIPTQPSFKSPKKVTFPYDVSEGDESKYFICVNWTLPDVSDHETQLGLEILSHILLGTPASPLRKTLIDSGLGEGLVGGGLDDSLHQNTYAVGLRGVAGDDVDQVETLILETLAALATEGIDQGTVAASLNTVEFSLRELNTGRLPRGLVLMYRSAGYWMYTGDPFGAISFEAPLSGVKARVEAGEKYFEGLLRIFLVENQHRVTVILAPDDTLAARREAAERQRLDQARASMTQTDLEALVENTRALKAFQEAPNHPEDLAQIPTLTLADLDREVRKIPITISEYAGSKVLYHELATNGIVYLDAGFNLQALPREWLPYLPLFGRALTQTGTQKDDFVQLSQRIGRSTGGIHAARHISARQDSEGLAAWLFLRGKATLENLPELLDILNDVLLTARLDNRERLLQMALETKAGMEAGLVQSGHSVVNSRLSAHYHLAERVNEELGGVAYLFFLRGLIDRIQNDWPAVQEILEGIRERLISRAGMVINATFDASGWQQAWPFVQGFIERLPASQPALADWAYDRLPAYEGLTIPAQVNYVGKGANLYDLGYELDGSLQVIRKYLGTTYIWDSIRVKGGAYGGFCSFDQHTGVWNYLSYRDPNLLATIDAYDGTAQFLEKLDLDESELTRGIIGVIGDLDAYQLPDAKGYTSMIRHLTGVTDADRQRRRDEILTTTPEDFRRFGAVLAEVARQGDVVVLGSPGAIEVANTKRGHWLTVKKVL
jgi:presequence protease